MERDIAVQQSPVTIPGFLEDLNESGNSLPLHMEFLSIISSNFVAPNEDGPVKRVDSPPVSTENFVIAKREANVARGELISLPTLNPEQKPEAPIPQVPAKLKSIEEREEEYRKARARIFCDSEKKSGDSDSKDSEKDNQSNLFDIPGANEKDPVDTTHFSSESEEYDADFDRTIPFVVPHRDLHGYQFGNKYQLSPQTMNPLMSPYYPWNMNGRQTFLTQTDDDWNPIPVNPMDLPDYHQHFHPHFVPQPMMQQGFDQQQFASRPLYPFPQPQPHLNHLQILQQQQIQLQLMQKQQQLKQQQLQQQQPQNSNSSKSTILNTESNDSKEFLEKQPLSQPQSPSQQTPSQSPNTIPRKNPQQQQNQLQQQQKLYQLLTQQQQQQQHLQQQQQQLHQQPQQNYQKQYNPQYQQRHNNQRHSQEYYQPSKPVYQQTSPQLSPSSSPQSVHHKSGKVSPQTYPKHHTKVSYQQKSPNSQNNISILGINNTNNIATPVNEETTKSVSNAEVNSSIDQTNVKNNIFVNSPNENTILTNNVQTDGVNNDNSNSNNAASSNVVKKSNNSNNRQVNNNKIPNNGNNNNKQNTNKGRNNNNSNSNYNQQHNNTQKNNYSKFNAGEVNNSGNDPNKARNNNLNNIQIQTNIVL